MRVLLLSCNTGEGHNSAAQALMQVLEQRGVECVMEDVLACLSPKFSKFVCSWHTRLYQYVPRLSDAGFRALERSGEGDEATPLSDLLARGNRKLWQIIAVGNFDAILCVHTFSALMMTQLRSRWAVREPCFLVDTDYSLPPFLEGSELDGYFIPAEDLKGDFIRAGIPEEKLIPSGIPVGQAFCRSADRSGARAELGLPEGEIVVLLMCGSMGCGPIRQIGEGLLRRLPRGSVTVVICGKNEKLFGAMSESEEPGLRVVGFTDKVASYMDAADLIVTKPGGLSATEAANKHLPMVLINAVGGCETKNFERFLRCGFALGSRDPEKVVEQAVYLATNAPLREKMIRHLTESFHTNSAQCIADHVMGLCIQPDSSGHPQRKGGCNMEFINSQTRINLARSFAGESQARTRYTVYAQQARKEGLEWVARIFEETAANEAVHAEEFLEQLQKLGGLADNIDLNAGYPFRLGSTRDNLNYAANGELEEYENAYPGFAEMARREGFDEAARLWRHIASIEGVHHNTFRTLAGQMAKDNLTTKSEPILWRCLNCGYTYESTQAAGSCPVCHKSSGWQEGELDHKKRMAK